MVQAQEMHCQILHCCTHSVQLAAREASGSTAASVVFVCGNGYSFTSHVTRPAPTDYSFKLVLRMAPADSEVAVLTTYYSVNTHALLHHFYLTVVITSYYSL